MTLVVAGIDEAGYGPMLGPLCVAMSVFEVDGWKAGDSAPDLWSLLGGAVCRSPKDRKRRIAIDDSKKLKLSNDSKTRHPLMHLERGVLAMLCACDWWCEDDRGLFDRLGTKLGDAAWYTGERCALPMGCDASEVRLAANVLRRAMGECGVRLVDLRCVVMSERVFNDVVARHGSKAAATGAAVAGLLRRVRDVHGERASDEGGPRVVVDRQGGRTKYGMYLSGALGVRVGPPAGGAARRVLADVRVVEERAERSRYLVTSACEGRGSCEMTVGFQTEAEATHLPVALASMTAKLVRELCMRRFNAYWCGRLAGLRPTAGYAMDAKRWLRDAAPVLDDGVRAELVRRA